MQALLKKTATAAESGKFEPFKTATAFDATARNPERLGEDPQWAKRVMPA